MKYVLDIEPLKEHVLGGSEHNNPSDRPRVVETVKDDEKPHPPAGGGPSSTPLGEENDVGSRIVSSARLLEECRKRLQDHTMQVWGDRIPGGAVTLLVGESSVGKTVFLHRLAYHLSRGEEFLGEGPERGLRVLFADFESNDEVLAEHLSLMGSPSGWDFYDLHDVELGPSLMKALKKAVSDGNYDLVVIDPLMEAYPVKDENDNAMANTQMLAFRDLARTTQAAVVVVHNSGLRTGKKQPKFLGRGASARVDRADIAINLTADKTGVRHLKMVKARSGNIGEEILFKFKEPLDYELAGAAPVSQTVVTKFASKVLDMMENLKAQGVAEVERKNFIDKLAIRNEAQEQALDRALKQLCISGRLTKPGKGCYSLTDKVGRTALRKVA